MLIRERAYDREFLRHANIGGEIANAVGAKMKALASLNKVPVAEIGKTGGNRLIINVNCSARKCVHKLNIETEEMLKLWSPGVNSHV